MVLFRNRVRWLLALVGLLLLCSCAEERRAQPVAQDSMVEFQGIAGEVTLSRVV